MLRVPEARFVGTVTTVGGTSFTFTPIAAESDGGMGVSTVVINTGAAPPINVRVGERIEIKLSALGG
ncbi:MAG: hypothetical protein ACRENJ_09925 [Candidatus Eiseniibacteriota bacterium]